MKINAVAVASSNLKKTVEFYKLIGFNFPDFAEDEQHVDSIHKPGETRLMIDSKKLMTELLGKAPVPANHSNFAIEFDTPSEIDTITKNLHSNGFTVLKQPWDAFWGQRYAVVVDPDGYHVDLYANL